MNQRVELIFRRERVGNAHPTRNYKAARELFDIDFKQQFGGILEEEEKAKWLRVFHSYIIDKKMEPLDAVEKIRKDYEIAGQEEPHPNPPRKQGGESLSPVNGGDKEGVVTRGEQGRTIDPTDSLFAGIGKSIVQGTTSFPRTFWGTGAMLEDITKSIPQAIPLAAFTQIISEDFFKRRYKDVKGIEERFQAKGEGYKKYSNRQRRINSRHSHINLWQSPGRQPAGSRCAYTGQALQTSGRG
ncbi:MAG: hypothetical protein CV087_04640 [Candidatus Brocadia sp. WS118]|nr:MAG: hypothetical protein CV087_04640 [Candidatus Brocadia sp. WS118]